MPGLSPASWYSAKLSSINLAARSWSPRTLASSPKMC